MADLEIDRMVATLHDAKERQERIDRNIRILKKMGEDTTILEADREKVNLTISKMQLALEDEGIL